MDELPEFQKGALEVLREPLEEKQIHISRLEANMIYPADFILVASMNPCPCGYYPNMNRCTCTPLAIHNYVSRVSQALLDRIDLCVEAKELSFLDIQKKKLSESSAEIRKRVEKVHKIQQDRYHDRSFQFNSQLTGNDMEMYCLLDSESRAKMEEKYEEYQLSARTYGKILKIARTIADMDDSGKILWKHLEEALCFRSPNKKYWR